MPERPGHMPEENIRYGAFSGGRSEIEGRTVEVKSAMRPGLLQNESNLSAETGVSEGAVESDADSARDVKSEILNENISGRIIDMINTALRKEQLPPDAVRPVRQNKGESKEGGDSWQINANRTNLETGLVFEIKPGFEQKIKEIMEGPIPAASILEPDRQFKDEKRFDFLEDIGHGFTVKYPGRDGNDAEIRFLYSNRTPEAVNDNEPKAEMKKAS